MKKYIIGLVLMFGLLIPLAGVRASGESDSCFQEREVMLKNGYVPFLPVGSKVPSRPAIESNFLKLSYGTDEYVTGGVNHYYTFYYGKSNAINVTQEQWAEIQAEITEKFSQEKIKYDKAVVVAKKALDKALAEKLEECNKIELNFIKKTTPKPVEEKIDFSDPVIACDPLVVSLLNEQIESLRRSNASLEEQVKAMKDNNAVIENFYKSQWEPKKKEVKGENPIVVAEGVSTIDHKSAVLENQGYAPVVVEKKEGFWSRIWHWLFD